MLNTHEYLFTISTAGHRSRHNLAYWHRSPYFAFGNGSSSYVLNRRFSRPRSLEVMGNYTCSNLGAESNHQKCGYGGRTGLL